MLHWDLEHFVVLTKVDRYNLHVNDPGRGKRIVSFAEADKHFSGIVVELSPRLGSLDVPASKKLTILDFVGRDSGIAKPMIIMLALSLFIELLLLIQPLVLRYTIDFGIDNSDGSLIGYLCLVSTLVALCTGAITLLRDRAALLTGSRVNLQVAQRLFRHTLSLPISFFEKRLTGDLADRYRSVEAIERILVGELPVGLLDGLFTLASLTVLFFISAPIAWATLLLFLLLAACRLAGLKRLRAAEEAVVFSRALEGGYLTESLHAILTIKVRAREIDRHSTWLSRFVDLVNAQHRLSRLQSLARALRVLVAGLDVAIFVALAFHQYRHAAFGVGTLFAIMFYKTHFSSRSSALVERAVGLGMLRMHLDRLEDVALAQSEAQLLPVTSPPNGPCITARDSDIVFNDVSFRYSPFDPPILHQSSWRIGMGEFVVLTGASGTGKTTILKLLLGLYRPDQGMITVGGVNTATGDVNLVRRQCGVVMQDDQLLIGTIAQNVAFFDPDINMDRVEWCCKQACLHDDITSTPMGYMGRVGGNAAGLSGGQRQRLLIARALYDRPRFLLLDEGTANLDPDREEAILANLKALKLTTLVIAHGASPLRMADRVLCLRDRAIHNV